MPLKLLEEDHEIEYEGYIFISRLPWERISEVFEFLKKNKELIYEHNPYQLEVHTLDYPVAVDRLLFAVTISKNNVLLDLLETTLDDL